jgi:predicted Zn-dependent protease
MIKKTICLFLIFLSVGVCANKKTKYEVRLGSNIAATILGQYQQSTDLKLIEYVNLVGQSIVQTSGRRDIHYYFTVLESDEPLDIACPGGYIFITKGLISMLKTESELAGILAHEIAHVNEKHVLNLVDEGSNDTTTMLTQMLMAKHTTSAVAFSEMSKKAVSILLEKGMNEDDEFEADIAAILFLNNTGYYAESYFDVLKRLPTEKIVHSKTHPDMDERISELRAIYPESFLTSGATLKERFDNYALLN